MDNDRDMDDLEQQQVARRQRDERGGPTGPDIPGPDEQDQDQEDAPGRSGDAPTT